MPETDTPMMKQYKDIKAAYPDAFLFYRLGDFYEMFFDDAELAARELEITLTKRGQKNENDIPMCGVPYHSAEGYIATLIEKGYKIAICEQVEDPAKAKGVVKREVVRMITPGTIMEGRALDETENNFLVAMVPNGTETAFVKADLTTGEAAAALLSDDVGEWQREMTTAHPKEIIVPEEQEGGMADIYRGMISTGSVPELKPEWEELTSALESRTLRDGAALLLGYVELTQQRSLGHLQPFTVYEPNRTMQLDLHSRRNLELTETMMGKTKDGSLLGVLDHTVTAMGGRKLRRWIEEPLLSRPAIEERYGMVASFAENFFAREDLREHLRDVYDIERLAGKAVYGNINARELVQLRRTLQAVPAIADLLSGMNNPAINERLVDVSAFQELEELLDRSLVDDPPFGVQEGGMFRSGFHEELDQYREAGQNGKQWIAELEQKERAETGIKSLKVGYNRVFGYYIEITRANTYLIPDGRYERKQTLTNAERYITPELKEKEDLILGSADRAVQLEYELFLDLRERVAGYVRPLQELADLLSEMDVLQNFAHVSERLGYVRPAFSADKTLAVRNGRHPVVETMLTAGEFVSNDTHMDEHGMLLITGPNMAGKSTVMRQVALIAIMAQIGCFVPAEEAELPLFDRIFTRIGAADDLTSGQSTFMVEMKETQQALLNASADSLILLDEIGRGTSTYDGMALAQAIMEYIHEQVGAKTLFSTHYHELTVMEDHLPALRNVHVRAVEEDGEIIFLHRVEPGRADRSYGIYVAKLAGLPPQVIERSETILKSFEQQKTAAYAAPEEPAPETTVREAEEPEQLALFSIDDGSARAKEIMSELKRTDVLRMSPMDAIEKLYELQQYANQEEE
ncbi:DNA mismatch repair protein MutS [Marinococcus halophilus]|uniref:DNA mismatch repair protein MutS n=1 Tax=Marinococcus halophilus TaxID=1371 RepID=A0A510Y2B9_MARHA|nr:DNA mismatch repair protein MutS [Marinococcus halophilus]OZT81501.1 DNA mismatch repair protein MutS [Marinococcus halophilus]GEK57462.1 DNA mismatch repair protein MutS [Marinococcus halophilus]